MPRFASDRLLIPTRRYVTMEGRVDDAELRIIGGRIVLGKPTNLWLDAALAEPGPIVEPLSARVAIESCELPGAFHGDPADRMIVATARVTNATLMSRDRRILDYAAGGHVTAVAA